ncbi:hypothetical protein ABG768_010620 [Culter alburnus]|uniref:Uncharacterized protein n=1 Tax=Culter alburnus TaxID=194366 RepID=A0AAW1ZAY7_CULAL
MKAHYKELTGIGMNDNFEEATTSKFRRILEYFQFQCTERASRAERILTKIRTGGDHVCGAVMLLLAHFKNDQDQFLVMVEDTCVPNYVCPEQLPPTPCIVVCGGCIFRINPHKGTKVEKREKKRVYSVKPKVLSLTGLLI